MNNSQKTIWMVSGNKGGVGKSLFCLGLASAFEVMNRSYSVVDGDGRTGDVYSAFDRKCPAKLGDFRELRPESHLETSSDVTYERMLLQMLAVSSDVIVNTPDGADYKMMKWFDVTLSHTEAEDVAFKFIYLMSERPDGLDMFPYLVERFQSLFPIRNLHFGPEKVFEKYNMTYAAGFYRNYNMPVLRNEDTRLLFDKFTYPGEVLNKSGMGVKTLSRSRIYCWQRIITDIVNEIVDNAGTPNVKKNFWKNKENENCG